MSSNKLLRRWSFSAYFSLWHRDLSSVYITIMLFALLCVSKLRYLVLTSIPWKHSFCLRQQDSWKGGLFVVFFFSFNLAMWKKLSWFLTATTEHRLRVSTSLGKDSKVYQTESLVSGVWWCSNSWTLIIWFREGIWEIYFQSSGDFSLSQMKEWKKKKKIPEMYVIAALMPYINSSFPRVLI